MEVIESIDPDEIDADFPFTDYTIGTLLYHIAAIEIDWLYAELLEQEFPSDFNDWFPHAVRDRKGNLNKVTGESLERHLGRLVYVRDKLRSALLNMSSDEYLRVRQLEEYDVNAEWVMMHLLQHEPEHIGQIKIMRRYLGKSGGPIW